MTAISLPPVLQRNAHYLPQVANLLCVVLLAIVSAQLAQSILYGFPSESVSTSPADMTSNAVITPRDTTPYGLQLARMHVMGNSSQAKLPQNTDAPLTQLNLKLHGVLALGDGQGYAIIQGKNRKDVLYHIDSEIISGVTLHSVFDRYVLISRAGRQEKLALPKAQNDLLTSLDTSPSSADPARDIQA
tara:strand:- start:598 stop:1161 length:564 start_codon:yes stop_codon:yes gene_type:complete